MDNMDEILPEDMWEEVEVVEPLNPALDETLLQPIEGNDSIKFALQREIGRFLRSSTKMPKSCHFLQFISDTNVKLQRPSVYGILRNLN
jgi:hypothetical protein